MGALRGTSCVSWAGCRTPPVEPTLAPGGTGKRRERRERRRDALDSRRALEEVCAHVGVVRGAG